MHNDDDSSLLAAWLRQRVQELSLPWLDLNWQSVHQVAEARDASKTSGNINALLLTTAKRCRGMSQSFSVNPCRCRSK